MAVDGTTSLMYACSKRYTNIACVLLGYGPDASMQNNDKTAALHYACFHQMKACVEQLLANGGDPNAKDIQGLTPLIAACFKRHGSIGSCHFGNPIVSWC